LRRQEETKNVLKDNRLHQFEATDNFCSRE
jgi:hypothetical protein